MDRFYGYSEIGVSPLREKDFGMPLSDLGDPDEICVDGGVFAYFRGGIGGCYERQIAKWIVKGSSRPFPYKTGYEEIKADEAEVHFTGKMLDDTEFVSTRENHAPMTVKLAQDDVMKGFSLAVYSMRPGEKAVFTIPQKYALSNSGCPASIPRDIPLNQTLRFDIELICFITDVHKDQGIIKRTIKYGTWYDNGNPHHLDEVFVKYNACLEDGTSVSSSAGVEFVVADGLFCPAFADVVKTMRNGEEAVVVINPKYGFGERGRPSVGDEASVPPDSTLHLNIQLMSWREVSFIGETREILKKRLHKVYKRYICVPRNQAIVKVRLIGKLQDGTVFDRRGHNGEEPFEFTIDEEHVIYGIDEAVMTMEEGEIACFTIPPQHAFGAGGSNQYKLAIVPPDSVVIYEIELVSVTNEEPSPNMRMTREDNIQETRRKVQEGDNLFDMAKFLRAYRRYFKARQLLWMTKGQDSEINEMNVLVALKCAECAIQLQRHKQASDRYHEVLRYDPHNEKAMQMVAKLEANGTIVIDEAAMHRGLEIPFLVPQSLSMWRGKEKPSNPSGRTIHAPPPVATLQASASQSVSTASAVAAGQGTQSTSVAGSSSTISLSQNLQSGSTSKSGGFCIIC